MPSARTPSVAAGKTPAINTSDTKNTVSLYHAFSLILLIPPQEFSCDIDYSALILYYYTTGDLLRVEIFCANCTYFW